MNHYSFESVKLSSVEEANLVIQKSIFAIEELNPDITSEGIEIFIKRQFNSTQGLKQLNSWLGYYKKYPLKKGESNIGFFELFIENDLKFITVYTSPV